MILLLCAGAGWFAWQYFGATSWVNHSTDVIEELRDTRMLLPGIGVLSGVGLQAKASGIVEQFDRATSLIGDNPRQRASAEQFRAIFTPPSDKEALRVWRVDGPSIAGANAILDRMLQEEYRLLTERLQLQAAATRNGAFVACGLCIALLVLGGFLGEAALREFRRREAAETALVHDKEELTKYSRKLALVSAGSELIQAARDEVQIKSAVAQVLRDLLPDSRGYFGLISPSNDLVEICGAWGEGIEQLPFAPTDCLAIQLGKPVHRDDSLVRMDCEHVRNCVGDYVCIPVRSPGGQLGVLHVETKEKLTSKRVDAIALFAAHLGLGLTNLRMREALRRQTVRDPLTGLFNRRYFDETLGRELVSIARHGMPVSVVMLDVDHFKELNDTHGHSAGDNALKTLARGIRSSFRASDVLCRYGGEEFALILPGATLEDAWSRAESFRQLIEQTELTSSGRSVGRMTISLGVAASTEFDDSEQLVRAADAALYQAKRMGRNATWLCSDRGGDLPAIPVSTVHVPEELIQMDTIPHGALA